MTDIKLQNRDKKFSKRNICSNIIKTEMLLYEGVVVILLNKLDLNQNILLKVQLRRLIIIDAIAHIDI